MKLFKSLLLAPTALGLLAPLAANATEINLNDVSNYSDVDSIEFANSFDNDEESIEGTLIAGGEGLGNRHSHDGSFSETTTLSGSAHFQIGSTENSGTTEALTSTYAYDLDLNTSFTGEDNLYVGIEAGNGVFGTVDFVTDNSNAQGDTLTVDSLYYAMPLGEYELAFGPKLDNDDFMPTSTSKYSDRFVMAGQAGGMTSANFSWDMGVTGTGVAVARTWDNGWNASASIIGLSGSSSSGFLTKEGNDVLTVSAGYDAENYGLGLVYVDADEACTFYTGLNTCTGTGWSEIEANTFTLGGYWTPNDGTTTFSATYGTIDITVTGTGTQDINELHLGVDHQTGNGVLSAAIKSSEFWASNGNADPLGEFAEIYYTYDVNDSMEVTGGFAFAMPDDAGTTWIDRTAVGLEATFKF